MRQARSRDRWYRETADRTNIPVFVDKNCESCTKTEIRPLCERKGGGQDNRPRFLGSRCRKHNFEFSSVDLKGQLSLGIADL